jgi:hydroxypyruvate isomerase
MFTLSANISMLFPQLPFLQRIGAAAQAGFRAVECHFPYAIPARDVAAELARHGVVMNGINTPPGDPSKGEFGVAAVPGQEARFRAEFAQALDCAQALGARMIHVMSGVTGGLTPAARETFLANLTHASAQAAACNICLLIEPLNNVDRPGYFVARSDDVASLLEELGAPCVKMLFDIYHIQIMEGDLLRRLARHWPHIGHVQLAGVPERHEPDLGEINVGAILTALEERGYEGFVGAEYNPRGDTVAGLTWAKPWLAP